eukprot:GHRQ01029551.1.p3 GENE.GHRQ01029551.1~~GHRQ01029551.1.p3  ORF type:complete len:109 (-),score=42.24 GHRQ01029551.1:210-536(-)
MSTLTSEVAGARSSSGPLKLFAWQAARSDSTCLPRCRPLPLCAACTAAAACSDAHTMHAPAVDAAGSAASRSRARAASSAGLSLARGSSTEKRVPAELLAAAAPKPCA